MEHSIGSRDAKDDLFDGFARVAAAFGSGRRLEIIDVLAQAPRNVEDLSVAIGQSIANTSHHLQRLAGDGLVRADRDGRHVVYRLASEQVFAMWRALQDVAAAHYRDLGPRAAAYVGDRNQIRVIDREGLRRRLQAGEDIVVIDVRPEAEYAAGHIEGAVLVPPDRLDDLLVNLPPRAEVVAYCRGRYCANADRAVRHLQAAGRIAYRLEEGYRDWVVDRRLVEGEANAGPMVDQTDDE